MNSTPDFSMFQEGREPHPTTQHIDSVISRLPGPQFTAINEALRDLLAEIHENATEDGAFTVLEKVERIARELGIDIGNAESEEAL